MPKDKRVVFLYLDSTRFLYLLPSMCLDSPLPHQISCHVAKNDVGLGLGMLETFLCFSKHLSNRLFVPIPSTISKQCSSF